MIAPSFPRLSFVARGNAPHDRDRYKRAWRYRTVAFRWTAAAVDRPESQPADVGIYSVQECA